MLFKYLNNFSFFHNLELPSLLYLSKLSPIENSAEITADSLGMFWAQIWGRKTCGVKFVVNGPIGQNKDSESQGRDWA